MQNMYWTNMTWRMSRSKLDDLGVFLCIGMTDSIDPHIPYLFLDITVFGSILSVTPLEPASLNQNMPPWQLRVVYSKLNL